MATNEPGEEAVESANLTSTAKDSTASEPSAIDTLRVIVVQCSNGYEYAMHGYDFNPVIETELDKFENIKVEPFPLKKLMGVAYQGVFDKKYCPPIIEKVEADYLVLTQFSHKSHPLVTPGIDWGYELRIVNTATLEQVNSISAANLKEYHHIEEHIMENIGTLKDDIEKLK